MVFFSATTLGYYLGVDRDEYLEAGSWPVDAVELSANEKLKFWGVQAPPGKLLAAENGRPTWVDIPPPPAPTLEVVQALRLDAYRSESDPLYMEWQFDQTAESEAAWRAKVSQIKGRYPLPAS